MKAIVFDKTASPADDFAAFELREISEPRPKADEVLVQVLLSSIDPTDFLFAQNIYPEPVRPKFPAQIAGSNGVGIVKEAGKNTNFKPGSLVAIHNHKGVWAEYCAVKDHDLFPLPTDYSLEKATQIFNAVTAWDLIDRSGIKGQGYLALTAGNSVVASLALQFANQKQRGVKVISLVRNVKEDFDLRALGAVEVIETARGTKDIAEIVSRVTSSAGVNAVIDCVGGPILAPLVKSLALGGKALLYGGFRTENFELHNFDLLTRLASIETYVYRYFFSSPPKEAHDFIQEVIHAFGSDSIKIPVAAAHPIEGFRTALNETLHFPGKGKQFLKF